jgi:membrane protease YdiL (CAAX protease family)
MLFAYIPIFAALTFLLTWCYRRTGRVYLGAVLVAAIATWFTTAGSVLAR